MRVRKIHAVLAVSVALALVAYSMEARRREDDEVLSHQDEILTGSPEGEAVELSEPVEIEGDEVGAQTEPLAAMAASTEPSVADPEPQAVEETPDAEPDSRRGRRRAPLLTAAVLVLVVVAAGAFLAVEAIASTAHHTTLLQHH